MLPFLSCAPLSGELTFIQTTKDSSNQNLTTLGNLDWANWTGFSGTPANRKTGGGSLISVFTAIGGTIFDSGTVARTITASDPTVSTTSTFSGAGPSQSAENFGIEGTIQATNSLRKAYFLLGHGSGGGKIALTLSDASAPPIEFIFSNSAIYQTELLVVEVNFRSNSGSATLNWQWTLFDNIDFGGVGIQAIALSTV